MLRDVTLGRYIEKEGALHKINPLMKLLSLLTVVLILFMSRSPESLLISVLFLCILISLSGIKPKFLLRGLTSYFIAVLIFTFVRTAFRHFSLSSVESALITAVRLILIMLFSSLYSCVTRADESSRALEILLSPLSVFGFNARSASLVFSVALRFLPVLGEQAYKIRQAQMSRISYRSSSLTLRFKLFMSVLVPLFAHSYYRSLELAKAMDSRGLDASAPATHLYPLKFGKREILSVLVLVLYISVFNIVRCFL